LQRKYHIRYIIRLFAHENIGSPVNWATNQMRDNQLGFAFVLLWQTSMNVLRITETATHRQTAPTRLEVLTVPVLMDISATGSPAQVTNERLFYI